MIYDENAIWHVPGFFADKDKLDVLNNYIYENVKAKNKEVFLISQINNDEVKNIMNEAFEKTISFIRDEYITKHMGRTIKNDMWSRELELIKWGENDVLAPHYDGDNPEDALPPPQDTAKIGSLIYLNDDYNGGEIGFPNYNIKVKPVPGDLVIFPYFYLHEVHMVLLKDGKASRHTMPMFNSFNLN